MNYKLVPMDRGNVPDVAAIERECFERPWSEDLLAEELYHDNASYIVAVAEDGTVLGYAALKVVLDSEFTLRQAAAAHERIEAPGHIGKIVMKVENA